MKNLLFLSLIFFSLNASGQATDAKAEAAIKSELNLAGAKGDQISVKGLLQDPVLRLGTSSTRIGGFEISWVVVSDKQQGPTYMGPYIITGSTITPTAFAELKSNAANGRITRMFVENVHVTNIDGTVTTVKGGRAYKAVE